MSRLFRQRNAGLAGYAALALFAATYLSALALIVNPGALVGSPDVETYDPATP
jgi:hypothetical protein